MEFAKAELLPVNVIFEDRRRYYDCFADYHQSGGNPAKLVDLIADYEAEELSRYITMLN